jgi:N-formylglutamate amidohydrolase
VAEALQRIRSYYWPYHKALKELVDDTLVRFGVCLLLDCHSMPSGGAGQGAGDDIAADLAPRGRAGQHHGPRSGAQHDPRRVDLVLGDCHGTACSPAVVERAAAALQGMGYRVSRNQPYSGGFVTRHYGRPDEGLHALQIEINRSLYMDESTFARARGFQGVARDMSRLVAALGELDPAVLAAR